jgi:hypothetical protein
MIKISHRGNLYGPDLNKENTVDSIFNAISKKYEVEIDVWTIDGYLYFGHDMPEHRVDLKIINNIGLNGWFHCKNLESLTFFKENLSNYKFFWHQTDDFTLTSNNYIWTYPGKNISKQSIIVHLEKPTQEYLDNFNGYGICSDYIGHL